MKKLITLIVVGGLLASPIQAADSTSTNPFMIYIDKIIQAVLEFLGDAPSFIVDIFKEEVLPVWEEMYQWFLDNIWEKIRPYTEDEIERRKAIAEQEAEREKEELLQELEDLSLKNSIFEKIKELLIAIWD